MSNLINGFCLLTAQADAFTVTPTDLSGAFVTLSEEQFAIG
jgi:hypothetical protein